MPADEKDSAATNRLLDLLRSQQTGKSTTEGNASGTLDANDPPEQADVSSKKKPGPAAVSSSIVPDSIVDEAPPSDEKSDSVSSDEIRAKLGNLASKNLSQPPVDEPAVEEVTEPENVPQGVAADLMDSSQDITTDTAAEPEKTRPIPGDSAEITGSQLIDPTYFQIHQGVKNQIGPLIFSLNSVIGHSGLEKKSLFNAHRKRFEY
ncbi:MAG: hypothetical protein H8E26_12530 [FCB group bacterium]|nr:hypothetical protein [FCB group bacterium]MBL7029467.1 hypothetical protein [Candidatus Neomarinimicrobiota bacterium]MBL7123084.1 hypothetical protein [Candidatus Neomarinimicrobiota bacterium]